MRSSSFLIAYREPVHVVEAGSCDGDESRLGAEGVMSTIRAMSERVARSVAAANQGGTTGAFSLSSLALDAGGGGLFWC